MEFTNKNLIAIIVVSLLLPLVALATPENVIITQVIYDPANEATGEAVEIYNPTNHTVEISGWKLSTSGSNSDATIPASTILLPKQYYLIADNGWSNSSEPPADHEEAITLGNSDSGVSLLNNQTIVDAVGWGATSERFLGNPALEVASGKSLIRKYANEYQDTKNNSADFLQGEGQMRSSAISSNEVPVFVEVINEAVAVSSVVVLQDDELAEGIQIIPFPGQNRTITAQVIASPGARIFLFFNGKNYTNYAYGPINESATRYELNFSVPHHLAPGILNATMTVSFDSTQIKKEVPLEIKKLMSLEVLGEALYFSSMNKSRTNQLTISNLGNVPVEVGMFSTDFISGTSKIDLIEISAGNFYIRLGKNRTKISSVQPNNQLNLIIRANYSSVKAGNYSGKIFIEGKT